MYLSVLFFFHCDENMVIECDAFRPQKYNRCLADRRRRHRNFRMFGMFGMCGWYVDSRLHRPTARSDWVACLCTRRRTARRGTRENKVFILSSWGISGACILLHIMMQFRTGALILFSSCSPRGEPPHELPRSTSGPFPGL